MIPPVECVTECVAAGRGWLGWRVRDKRKASVGGLDSGGRHAHAYASGTRHEETNCAEARSFFHCFFHQHGIAASRHRGPQYSYQPDIRRNGASEITSCSYSTLLPPSGQARS